MADIILGFTGSRIVDPRQMESLNVYLNDQAGSILAGRHGDCIGFDAIFDAILAENGIPRHIHPGHDRHGLSPYRAYCDGEYIHGSRPYLARNRDIVNRSDRMLACPSGPEMARGSGTWATIRYARSRKPLVIIWPDGTVVC